MPETAQQPVFYYDLGSPECYLVAEQVMSALPVVPEWEPVLASDLRGPAPSGRDETGEGSGPSAGGGGRLSEADRASIEAEAARLGLMPLRWPPSLPVDSRQAMLAATYAKKVGRAVAFSLAAFRQAFAGGRDLDDESTVVIAGAACEIHPTALLKGMSMRSVSTALEEAGRRAIAAGVTELPAIKVGGQVFSGIEAVVPAATALSGAESPDGPGSPDGPKSLKGAG